MKMENIEIEVIRMGDVGTVIDMVDTCIANRDTAQAERASLILKEIFTARYSGLQQAVYGGEQNA